MSRYVTVKMIAAHVKRTPQAVRMALRAARVQPQRIAGVKGLRLDAKDANKFINLAWPECGAL